MSRRIFQTIEAKKDKDLIAFRKQLEIAKAHLKKTRKSKAAYPLYLVIGPKNSGKTTLINQSELEFTDNPDITGISWRFTSNEAIIEMEQYPSANTWSHAFTLLEHFSAKHPLQGIVFTIDIRDWEQTDIEEQLLFLDTVLRGLDQHSPIPLYLVFTKCDLLAGFSEFYEEISLEARESAVGVQLDAESTGLTADFKEKFINLVQRLNSHIIIQLHQERDSKKAALIKHFPQQVEQFGNYIERFVDMFKKNAMPHLKGVYLTSSLQYAAAVDFLTPSYCKETHLPIKMNAQPPRLAPAPYFIKGLFNHVLRDQATRIIRKHGINVWAPILSVTLLAGFSGLFYYNYNHNMHVLKQTQKMMSHLNIIDEDDIDTRLTTLLSLSNSLRDANSMRYFLIGRHELQRLNARVQAKYQSLIQKRFKRELGEALETTLSSASSENLPQLYAALHVYNLLGSRNLSEVEQIHHWFYRYWSQDNTITPKKVVELQSHLTAYLNHFTPIKQNPALIAKAEQALSVQPLPKLLLAILASQDIQPAMSIVPGVKPVPSIYTRNQFFKIYNESIVTLASHLKHTNGLSPVQQTQLISDARTLYLKNYADAWKSQLDEFKIEKSDTIDQQIRLIESMLSDNSPIVTLLTHIQDNTSDINDAASFNQIVARQFASVNQLTSHWNTELVRPALKKLLNYLTTINSDQNRAHAAFDVARIWMESNGKNDPIGNLEQIATQLPEPVSHWVNDIAENSWQIILSDAKEYINQHWAREFYTQYQNTIMGHYPFDPNSNNDVSLTNFTAFFEPNGTSNTFFNTYLKPFVDTHDIYWTWKRVHGLSLPASQVSLEAFIRASLIQKMFFARTKTVPFTSFSLVPINASKQLTSFRFSLGNQAAEYTPGNRFVSNFSWPPQGNYLATIDFVDDQHTSKSLSASGPWALFRLLAKGNLLETDDPRRYKLRLGVDINHSTEYELLASTNINPFMPNVINRFHPPETF